MEIGPRRSLPVLRGLGVLALLGALVVPTGCGSSDSGGAAARQARPSASEEREARETRQIKRELASGDFFDCGGQVFVNKRSICAFAKNMQSSYYGNVVSGSAKVNGYHPGDEKDYRVYCTGTVPHRCTGFEDDGQEWKPLKGALIFFSP